MMHPGKSFGPLACAEETKAKAKQTANFAMVVGTQQAHF
jgi:hypothetical protein